MEFALKQPEMIGRTEELSILRDRLRKAMNGKGNTVFIAGEAGLGKTRLISELIEEAEKQDINPIRGWCLAENLQPLMPIREAFGNSGLFHLVAGEPPPRIISVYLIDSDGLLIEKSERQTSELDPDIFASMLTAVGNFVMDSLSMMGKEGGGLNTIGYGDHTIIIQSYGSISLACVIEGMKSEFLIEDIQNTLRSMEKQIGNWGGNAANIAGIAEKLSLFIDSKKYDGEFPIDDPKLRQENLFDNILRGLKRESRKRPLIIFIDDLQWADPTTLNLLHYLSRNTRKHNILILGTYRPEDIIQFEDNTPHPLHTTKQNMSREYLLEELELKRLSTLDTDSMITSVLGEPLSDKELVERIHYETEGNPFFILEVIKLLMIENIIVKDDKGLKITADIQKFDIPSKVYDVVQRRLDRLKDTQKEILECASIQGEEFRSQVIGNVLEMKRITLLKILGEIEEKHRLIHSMPDKYRFDHTKIAEVLYNGMIQELRKEYHGMVADSIKDLYGEEPNNVINQLAMHYYRAGDSRAIEYLTDVGHRAKDKYANREAASIYGYALEMIEENEARAEALENLGDIRSLMGDYNEAIEHFQEAGDCTTDTETRARNRRKEAQMFMNKGDFDRCLGIIEEAKDILNEETAESGRIQVVGGIAFWRKGDFDEAMTLFEEAIHRFEAGDNTTDMGNAFRAVGNIYSSKGDMKNALDNYERSLNIMERIDDRMGIAMALNNMGIIYKNMGDLDKALDHYKNSLELIEYIGGKQGTSMGLNNIGNVQMDKGDFQEALKDHTRSLNIKEEIGDRQGIAMSLANIGHVYRLQGEYDIAIDNYEKSLEICNDIGDKWLSVEPLEGLSELYLETGDLKSSHEFAKKNLKTTTDIEAKREEGMARCILGMVYREEGDTDRSQKEFELARNILEEVGDSKSLARLFYEHSILFHMVGESKQSEDLMSDALAIYQRLGMKYWENRCKMRSPSKRS